MKNIDELIERAKELKERGFTTGEIADELNISRETALWLITQDLEKKPRDIYVDWRSIGTNPKVLKYIALGMVHLVETSIEKGEMESPDVIAGIAVSGLPIATLMAEEMETELAVIRPKKHFWEPNKKSLSSFLLSNFSRVEKKKVLIVDDIATSGKTIRDAIELLENLRAKPIGAVVVVDKKNLKQIKGVPVISLIKVSIVE
ncbi:MAG: orotate phosphoribosyltransferase-like protein [Thermoplasmata archaeon]|nr:MAG: orotate phosphoribosyltransferase-like protein [Thermoplasmata archaeon]